MRLDDPEARREIVRLKHKHGLAFTPTADGAEFSHPTHGRCQIHLRNDRDDLAALLAWLREKRLEPPAHR